MEYLTKLKFYNIADDLSRSYYRTLTKNAASLEGIFGVHKRYVKILQELDMNFYELDLAKKFIKAKVPFNADYFRAVIKTFGGSSQTAIEYLKYASLEKIERSCAQFVDKFNNFSHIFISWKDYINACEKLGYDLKNDFVLFPKDLKKSHDLANKQVEKLRKKGKKKMLDGITKRLGDYFAELRGKYNFENDEYAVIVPSNLNDIVKEGHVLRHCVGGYAERVAEKRTIVLFLRLKSDINTPFYTMEISQGKIIQCRGMCNCWTTDEINEFVEIFKKNVLFAAKKRQAV
jgi:hypothetical protein